MSSQNEDDERPGPERTEQHTSPNNLPTQRPAPREQDEELDFSVDTFQKRTSKTRDDSGSGGFSEMPLPEPQPEWIGRYRVEKLLGKGGFGQVFLAVDDELRRKVTIKVPHAHRISSPADVEAFLDEARMLAKLEHPNVVPVHDVGQQPDGTCFIVSRYIDGSDLYERCLLYTSDAADDMQCVDLGGRRIIKNKNNQSHIPSPRITNKHGTASPQDAQTPSNTN